MKPKTQFSIWNVVAFVVVMIILQTLFLAPKEDHLPYSRFEELIQKGRVAEVVIGPQIIEGKYKGEDAEEGKAKIFKTVRVEDPDLVKNLTEHAVTFSGRYQSSLLNTDFHRWLNRHNLPQIFAQKNRSRPIFFVNSRNDRTCLYRITYQL